MSLVETRSIIAVLVASLVLAAAPVRAQDAQTAAAAEAAPLTDEDYDTTCSPSSSLENGLATGCRDTQGK